MAVQDFDATNVPQDIVAALSLQIGTTYVAQNVGTVATAFVREAPAAPAATDRAFRTESGGFFYIKPEGDPIWVWTDDPAGCPLVVDVSA